MLRLTRSSSWHSCKTITIKKYKGLQSSVMRRGCSPYFLIKDNKLTGTLPYPFPNAANRTIRTFLKEKAKKLKKNLVEQNKVSTFALAYKKQGRLAQLV